MKRVFAGTLLTASILGATTGCGLTQNKEKSPAETPVSTEETLATQETESTPEAATPETAALAEFAEHEKTPLEKLDDLYAKIDNPLYAESNLGGPNTSGKISSSSIGNPHAVMDEIGLGNTAVTPAERGAIHEYLANTQKYTYAAEARAFELDGFKGLSQKAAEAKIDAMSEEERAEFLDSMSELSANAKYDFQTLGDIEKELASKTGTKLTIQSQRIVQGQNGPYSDFKDRFLNSSTLILTKTVEIGDGVFTVYIKEDCENLLTAVLRQAPRPTPPAPAPVEEEAGGDITPLPPNTEKVTLGTTPEDNTPPVPIPPTPVPSETPAPERVSLRTPVAPTIGQRIIPGDTPWGYRAYPDAPTPPTPPEQTSQDLKMPTPPTMPTPPSWSPEQYTPTTHTPPEKPDYPPMPELEPVDPENPDLPQPPNPPTPEDIPEFTKTPPVKPEWTPETYSPSEHTPPERGEYPDMPEYTPVSPDDPEIPDGPEAPEYEEVPDLPDKVTNELPERPEPPKRPDIHLPVLELLPLPERPSPITPDPEPDPEPEEPEQKDPDNLTRIDDEINEDIAEDIGSGEVVVDEEGIEKNPENLVRIDDQIEEDITDNIGTEELEISKTTKEEAEERPATERPSGSDYLSDPSDYVKPEESALTPSTASGAAESVDDSISDDNDSSVNRGEGVNFTEESGSYAPVVADHEAQEEANNHELDDDEVIGASDAGDLSVEDLLNENAGATPLSDQARTGAPGDLATTPERPSYPSPVDSGAPIVESAAAEAAETGTIVSAGNDYSTGSGEGANFTEESALVVEDAAAQEVANGQERQDDEVPSAESAGGFDISDLLNPNFGQS